MASAVWVRLAGNCRVHCTYAVAGTGSALGVRCYVVVVVLVHLLLATMPKQGGLLPTQARCCSQGPHIDQPVCCCMWALKCRLADCARSQTRLQLCDILIGSGCASCGRLCCTCSDGPESWAVGQCCGLAGQQNMPLPPARSRECNGRAYCDYLRHRFPGELR